MTMISALASGIYDNLPAEQYHADSAVGSSTLKKLASMTPAHARYVVFKQTEALEFGAAFDMCLLERPNFDATYVRGPETRRGKQWTDALAYLGKGKILLPAKDYDNVVSGVAKVMENPDVAALLGGKTIRQQSAFWTDKVTGLRCKVRPDLLCVDRGIMVDLKTTKSADARSFGWDCIRYGYDIQQAMYMDGYAQLKPKAYERFLFLAVEKTYPFLAAVYELDAEAVKEGYDLYRAMLEAYKGHKEQDAWPGYPSGIQQLVLPKRFKGSDAATASFSSGAGEVVLASGDDLF